MRQDELEHIDHILTVEAYKQWMATNIFDIVQNREGNLIHAYLRAHDLPLNSKIEGLT
jgi:hypothetical protein